MKIIIAMVLSLTLFGLAIWGLAISLPHHENKIINGQVEAITPITPSWANDYKAYIIWVKNKDGKIYPCAVPSIEELNIKVGQSATVVVSSSYNFISI